MTWLCSSFTFAASDKRQLVYCGANPGLLSTAIGLDVEHGPGLLEGELSSMQEEGEAPKPAIVVDLYGQLRGFRRDIKPSAHSTGCR